MIKYFFVVFILCFTIQTNAIAKSDYFVRNYPFGITIPENEFEISTDYLVMNDTVDVFDFKESRSSSVSSAYQSETLGEYQGLRFIGNYGLTSTIMLAAHYNFKNLDITFGNYLINNFELSGTKYFQIKNTRNKKIIDYFFINSGIKHNNAADYNATDLNEINHFAQRIDNSVSIYSTPGRVNITNGSLTYSSSIVDSNGQFKDPLTISIKDSSDISIYFRGGIGKQLNFIHASLFTEIGRTAIKGQLDNNLHLYGITNEINQISKLSKSLDRNENFAKFGFNIYYKSKIGFTANMSYYYLTIDRSENLDYVNYNHVIEGNLSMWITDYLALNIGAEYYYRQFAGVIPFLYNEYSQTAFDHDYGVANIGLIAKF